MMIPREPPATAVAFDLPATLRRAQEHGIQPERVLLALGLDPDADPGTVEPPAAPGDGAGPGAPA